MSRFPQGTRGFAGFVGLMALVVVGCGGPAPTGTGGPGPAANVAKTAGDNQSAAVGATVTTAPSVRVTDAQSRAVPGVSITFAVTGGGGSVTGATATTDANGVAAVGSWTLGQATGPNTLSATAAGVSTPASFTATANPGPPTTLEKVLGDNQIAPPSSAVPIAPQVRARDQFGNPVQGHGVTFAVATGGGVVTGGVATTDANGLATVGSWTLGAANGAQTLTATAAGAGITGNPATFTATAQLIPLQPSKDTTLSGNAIVASLNVGAGITVTAAADLVLTVRGPVLIDGTLRGNCVAMTLNADGLVTVNGNLRNDCAVSPDNPPTLSITALGGLEVTAGTITTSGDFEFTDDPTLTDNDFLLMASPPTPFQAAAAALANPCLSMGTHPLIYMPPKANPGSSSGAVGGPGRDGRDATARCRGDIIFGGAVIRGQDGGDGGNGTSSTAGVTARGGKGGDGGKVTVRSAGTIRQVGALGFSTIGGGAGGQGGMGTAMAPAGGGAKAPSATAEGGDGGRPGLVEVRARVAISAPITIDVPPAGDGGKATAVGQKGADATAAAAAQEGGDGTATGGKGGAAPDKMLSTNGAIGVVDVSGGLAGLGGVADATGGMGGMGNRMFKPGGKGGSITSNGGAGGNSDLRDDLGALVGAGGDGGDALSQIAMGGIGWSDCKVPLDMGGKGGMGGMVSGKGGAGGLLGGAVDGAAGVSKAMANTGNGGKGGDGFGPETGGAGGNDGRTGNKMDGAPIFMKGPDGAGCPVSTTWTIKDDVPGHEPVLQLTAAPHTILVIKNGTSISLVINVAGFVMTASGTCDAAGNFTASGTFTKSTPFGTRQGLMSWMGTITAANGQFAAMVAVTVFGQTANYNVTGQFPPEMTP